MRRPHGGNVVWIIMKSFGHFQEKKTISNEIETAF